MGIVGELEQVGDGQELLGPNVFATEDKPCAAMVESPTLNVDCKDSLINHKSCNKCSTATYHSETRTLTG